MDIQIVLKCTIFQKNPTKQNQSKIYGSKTYWILRSLSKTNLIIDVCSSDGHNFCKNGGTCYVEQENRIKCNCPREFDGLYCEVGKKDIRQT